MSIVPGNRWESLREIAWSIWDPIGLANHPDWKRDAPDEYDNYVQHAATLFENGASIVDVATYLAHIEAEYMSLGVKGTTADRARRTATAIKQYLETATD